MTPGTQAGLPRPVLDPLFPAAATVVMPALAALVTAAAKTLFAHCVVFVLPSPRLRLMATMLKVA